MLFNQNWQIHLLKEFIYILHDYVNKFQFIKYNPIIKKL